jgi:hypothetical protein
MRTGDIELAGFTLTADEWRAFDDETRALLLGCATADEVDARDAGPVTPGPAPAAA